MNPINVGHVRPRLSWVDNASGHNWRQSAYQIQVATSLARLKQNKPDLWDSGRVNSSDSNQIEYRGNDLHSRELCYWRVRVWDQLGSRTDWNSAHFELGILSKDNWRDSKWIGITAQPGDHPSPFLRKEFDLSGKARRATLYVAGAGYAQIHANGREVAPGVEREPGYTDFGKRILSVAYDVTSLLRPGRNALGAVLGTGWYDVHDKATWNFDEAPWRGRPRLRLLLAIELVDGTTQWVTSDRTWKATTGPILRDGIYTGEVYDARKEMEGWNRPHFNDSEWRVVDDLGTPTETVVPRACPPIRICESIRAKSVVEPKPGVYIVDMGRNFSGHVRLHVNAPKGTQVRLRYSERIGKDGMIDRAQIEQFMAKADPPQPFQTDTYICRGGGNETWEQRFSYSGFRYVEVTGLPYKPTQQTIEGRFAHTDLESAGEFSCSNELFNQIQRATLNSYFSNAQSIPTDCPQREKNGWTGDAQLAAEAGLMNFRSETFYTKWLDDLADTESPTGRMSIIVPTGGWGAGGRHPAWDSAYPIVAEELRLYTRDSRALSNHYDNLKRYVDSLAGELCDGVLTFDSLGDWVPWHTETPSTFTSTIYLYADAQILREEAMRHANLKDASHFGNLCHDIQEGVEKHFYTNGTYANGSQTSLAMALYFGLVPLDRRDRIFKELVDGVGRLGHIDTGILGAKYLLRVLSEGGRTDLAYQLVNRREQPGWGWWMSQGATTLWEDWKGESSLNHIMFGDVSNWFYQWIAGIGLDPSQPGFQHILIQPHPVQDLTWASAFHDSLYGRVHCSWKKSERSFRLDLTIPANTTARVTLPALGELYESGRPIGEIPYVKVVNHEGQITPFEIGSGTYSFEVRTTSPK